MTRFDKVEAAQTVGIRAFPAKSRMVGQGRFCNSNPSPAAKKIPGAKSPGDLSHLLSLGAAPRSRRPAALPAVRPLPLRWGFARTAAARGRRERRRGPRRAHRGRAVKTFTLRGPMLKRPSGTSTAACSAVQVSASCSQQRSEGSSGSSTSRGFQYALEAA